MDGQALRHKLHKAAASVVSGLVAVKAEIYGLDVRAVREKAHKGFTSHATQRKVNHPDGRQTRYGHLSKVLVSAGQTVSPGTEDCFERKYGCQYRTPSAL